MVNNWALMMGVHIELMCYLLLRHGETNLIFTNMEWHVPFKRGYNRNGWFHQVWVGAWWKFCPFYRSTYCAWICLLFFSCWIFFVNPGKVAFFENALLSLVVFSFANSLADGFSWPNFVDGNVNTAIPKDTELYKAKQTEALQKYEM